MKLIITLNLDEAAVDDSLDLFDIVAEQMPNRWMRHYSAGESGDIYSDKSGELLGEWAVE